MHAGIPAGGSPAERNTTEGEIEQEAQTPQSHAYQRTDVDSEDEDRKDQWPDGDSEDEFETLQKDFEAEQNQRPITNRVAQQNGARLYSGQPSVNTRDYIAALIALSCAPEFPLRVVHRDDIEPHR